MGKSLRPGVKQIGHFWRWSEQEARRGGKPFSSPPSVCASPLHPRQPGCTAPLFAPWRAWLLAGVSGRGAAAHPCSPDPPRPGAHPAQCAGRLGGGSVRSGIQNRGLPGESQVQEALRRGAPALSRGTGSVPSRLRRAPFPACAFSHPGCGCVPAGLPTSRQQQVRVGREPARVPAAGLRRRGAAQQVDRNVRSPAPGRRVAGGLRAECRRAWPAAGQGCARGTFRPAWKCERPRPRGLPAAAGREASAGARRHPSPTSAARRFLVPGSQGPAVPREPRQRSPTPAGASRSHAPAAVSPEPSHRGSGGAGRCR